MTPEEERALAHGFARRIADLFNEIELSEDHGLMVNVDEVRGVVFISGKYADPQAQIRDTYGDGWKVME